MNSNDNANRNLRNFEDSIHSRKNTSNKNSTLQDYTDNLAAHSVGNLVDGLKYDDDYDSIRSNNKNNSTYNDYDNTEDYSSLRYDEFNDTSEFDFTSDDLDSLNGLSEDSFIERNKRQYDHQIPYNRYEEDEMDYDHRQNSSARRANNTNVSRYDTTRYNTSNFDNLDTSSYSNQRRGNNFDERRRSNREDSYYGAEEDYIRKSFQNGKISQDTSNLAEIDNVRNFYNDVSQTAKIRNDNNRRMANLEDKEYFDTLSTMANLEAIQDKPRRKRNSQSNIKYKTDDTLKNKIDYDSFDEDEPIIERPRKNHHRAENQQHRRDTSRQDRERVRHDKNSREHVRRDNIEQKRYEERKRRLSEKRRQDTSMQPVIRGYTGTIPTINDQRYSENKHSRSYDDNSQDMDYTQRHSSAEIRRSSSQQQPPSKRNAGEVYRRRYEKAVARTILFSSIGLVTTLLSLGAFFFMTYKYNDLKDKYATLNDTYQTLKLQQADIVELQLEIDKLQEEKEALLNGTYANGENNSEYDNNLNDSDNISNSQGNNNQISQTENRTHTVQSGDYLSSISTKYYGDASHVQEIKDANSLTSDNITVGQTLIIP